MSGHTRQLSHLPDRFPVGTKFVIEGRAGHIPLQYLEFPDGRRVNLAAGEGLRTLALPAGRRPRDAYKATPKKYLKNVGTPARLAS